MSAISFLLASWFGLSGWTLLLSGAVGVSTLAALCRFTIRRQLLADIAHIYQSTGLAISRRPAYSAGIALYYSALVATVWAIFDRAMFERGGEVYTGNIHNVGDLPFHLQTIASFVFGANLPPEHPMYAGARFIYPFLADFFTASLAASGAPLRDAIFLQNLVLAVALIGILQSCTWQLTRDRVASLLAPALVLFSGGLGWWLAVVSVARNGLGVLQHLPQNYTIASGTGWRWGNSLTALFTTQRSLLLGLPVALCIFTQWWMARSDECAGGEDVRAEGAHEVRRMAAAGVLAGLLPLVHAHTFLVVIGVGAYLAIASRRWRLWAVFFGLAAVLALPQAIYLTAGAPAGARSFLGISVGWDRGSENPIWFWLKNTGFFIPALFAAILWTNTDRGHVLPSRLLRFYIPFSLCFVVPNLVKLAPWVWDNIKVLFYWYVMSVPLVALWLSHLWKTGRVYRTVAVTLFVTLTLAGGLDVWRVVSRTAEYREFDRNSVEAAQQVMRHCEPGARILHAPVYNPAVSLTGRRSLLGYPGIIWSHGLDHTQRERDIRAIYAGVPEAPRLLANYKINYVLVSPAELAYTPVNQAFFRRYTRVAGSGGYNLYSVAQ